MKLLFYTIYVQREILFSFIFYLIVNFVNPYPARTESD